MARKRGFRSAYGVPEGLRDLFDNLVVVAPWVRIDRTIPGAFFVPDEAARAAGYLVGAGVIEPRQASPVEELIRQAGPTEDGEFATFLYVSGVGDDLSLARLVARTGPGADGLTGLGDGEVISEGIIRWRSAGEDLRLSYLIIPCQPKFWLVGAVESPGGVTDLIDEVDAFVVNTFFGSD